MAKPIRTQLLDRINEGGATKEILLQMIADGAAERGSVVKSLEKALSSQFTYLRMMGQCPMLDENNIYKIVSAAEWDAHRAEIKANSKTKTLSPEKRHEKAVARVERAEKSLANAEKRCEDHPDSDRYQLYEWQKDKADLELKIAKFELDEAVKLLPDSPAETQEQAPAETAESETETDGAFA